MNIFQLIIDYIYYLFSNSQFITFYFPAGFEKVDGNFNPVGGFEIGIPLLAILLIPTGIYFTLKTKCLIVRFFPEMIRLTLEKKKSGDKNSLSGLQALIVSTATRVGMGNLLGVAAAIAFGGAGSVFWMWVTALLGTATAYIEATLAQLHKEKDPLYGGYRGGPAQYLHALFAKGTGKKKSVIACLFAISALLCWGGISQVIGNSVASDLTATFNINPLYTAIALVILCAVIVLRKNTTVKVLDIIVPIMAVLYFIATIVFVIINFRALPGVFGDIFSQALGLKPAASGITIGTIISLGAQRGLFSNEAGSGSAPCAAAAADIDNPVKGGLLQALGVFIDTIVICTCTALLILIAKPESTIPPVVLNEAMNFHMGYAGEVFMSIVLFLFCISTLLGVLFYARSNVAYLFGDNWTSQTIYKIFALAMLFVGCISSTTDTWHLADTGIALMTVFNLMALFPMAKEPLRMLKDYKKSK
ncbi:MAG: alanine:cation symporter family protein [Clostridia bacterium]|nr:alanine:cation symporter family protein [Clostridia bacterium]